MLSEQQIERINTMYPWLDVSPAELACHEPCSGGRTYLNNHRWRAASAWAACNNPGYMLWLLMYSKDSVTRQQIESLATIMAKHCLPKIDAAIPTYPIGPALMYVDDDTHKFFKPTIEQAQELITRCMQLLLHPSDGIITHVYDKYTDLIEFLRCITSAHDTEGNILWYECRQAALALAYALKCHRIFIVRNGAMPHESAVCCESPHRAVCTLVYIYIHIDNTYNGSPEEQEQFNRWACDTIRMQITPALRECITPDAPHDEESE